MTYNTMNPVPSLDPRDLDDNAEAFDLFLQSTEASEPDRRGVQRKTWRQMEIDAEALVSPNVTALAGLTLSANKGLYATGSGALALYDLSSLGRTLGGIANAAAGRSALSAAASGANTDITSITGSAASLTTSRSLSATGDATWTVNFNGAANATAVLTLAATGVAAGTYGSVTVDAKGRVTAGSTAGIAFTAWANLTLGNSWVVISGRRAAYRSFLDMVTLEVGISGGTAADSTALFTLPVGFRPAFPVVIPVASAPNTALSTSVAVPRVLINTDGVVTCVNCTNAAPGIVFSTTFSTV